MKYHLLKIIYFSFYITLLFAQPTRAEIEPEKVNAGIAKYFDSVLKMFDGSQIATRYIYTETKGVETANKNQWRARLNFTYVLTETENGDAQWTLHAIGSTGNRLDNFWNNGAGVVNGQKIQDPQTDFFLRNIWLEYHGNSGLAQFGALESLPKGFLPGYASLDTQGWIKGARYISQKMEILGLKLDRVAITAGRIDDFARPMATDGWGMPNYYDISVEATPVEDLRVGISNSVFTGVKPEDVIDYSPRVYAEYQTTQIFKGVIDSITADARFHTKGDYPIQRVAFALNKKFKEGFLAGWSSQI